MKRFLAFALVTTAATFAHAQVHIDGSRDAVLELDDGDSWRPVCVAPCNVPIPGGPRYRISGPGVQTSRPFALPPQAQLGVDTGSSELHTLGLIAISFGGASLVASFVLFLSTIGYSCSDCIDGLANTTTANWGWGTLAGGVVGLVAGIVLVAETRTHVTLMGEPLAWVRVQDPTLGEASRMRRDATKAFGAPVFAVSF